MAYITPVLDWEITDYFNVVDWARINNNASLVSALSEIMLDTPLERNSVTDPTVSTDPRTAIEKLNDILETIENTRLAMNLLLPELRSVKYDWIAGLNNISPTAFHANQWEQTLDTIWTYWNGDSLPVCPTLSANLIVPTATQAIYIDCLDLDGFDVELQGTAELFII